MNLKRRQRHLRAALGRRPRVSRIRPGVPPGTLMAVEAAQAPVIHIIVFGRDGCEEQRVATIDDALARVVPGAVSWINIDGLGDSDVFARMGERLGLHALALEDVLNVPQRPKVERFDKHLFMVMRTMRQEAPGPVAGGPPASGTAPGICDEQVSLFLGPDWVITIQERSDGDSFEPVREAIRHGRGRVRECGADYLAYLLVDAVVDAYFPVVDALAERMHALEEQALQPQPPDDTLLRLTHLRHDFLGVRRAVWPMREEIAVLQREESALIGAETRVFLRDVYDHTIQALEIVESLREMAVAVTEVFLSAQNQRLNQVMKVLTVISTLFIPLTFIASIYGMNFKYMPELDRPWAYPIVLSVMAATAVAMLAFFKRQGWW